MNNIDSNNLHRLVKLALDTGEAETVEEALGIFSRYRLRLHLGRGWNTGWAGQAAVATILNTATRAFLGGVVISGEIDERFEIPLYRGLTAGQVSVILGATTTPVDANTPTLSVGEDDLVEDIPFCVRVEYGGWRAGISPAAAKRVLEGEADNPLAGVAAGALAVSEAFMHARREFSIAGNRVTGISLWNPGDINGWAMVENQGPAISLLPRGLWLVGLGHLGQAYAWTISMLPYAKRDDVSLFLQDTDVVTSSNLSTCMFADGGAMGQRKTRSLANKLEALGFETNLVERLFDGRQQRQVDEPRVALFGVDNVAARRAIEDAGFDLIIEAGLGSGHRDFRNLRMHAFPGLRAAANIWATEDGARQETQLQPAYERMIRDGADQCGVVMLASRAVGTPFVGTFTAAIVISEVVRLLHGGKPLAAVDISMRDLRNRSVLESDSARPRNPGYTPASRLRVA